MGFIKAALSGGISSFRDSKFKEAVVLPESVPSDALAVKGVLLTKDPDGQSRHGNQNTGLLTDGSLVIVPQGYVALLVNNGTFLGELLEAGSHEWQAGDNAWLLEKGGIKGTWENFKNRFSFGGQVVTQQEIIYFKIQPFTGNKFGTQNPVEYFSERYQQLLSIRFYGLYDVKISDPVLFYISSVSHQITVDQPFTLQDVAKGTLRQNLPPKIAVAIAKYTADNQVDIYSLNANQEVFNELAKHKGIGEEKAIHILANIEFARRIYSTDIPDIKCNSPEVIARFLKSSLENLTQEFFIVLDIDTKGKILEKREESTKIIKII